jgi:hypothetical protein
MISNIGMKIVPSSATRKRKDPIKK